MTTPNPTTTYCTVSATRKFSQAKTVRPVAPDTTSSSVPMRNIITKAARKPPTFTTPLAEPSDPTG